MTFQTNNLRWVVEPRAAYPFGFLAAMTVVQFGSVNGLAAVALIVLSLLLHECGHAMAAYACGVAVSEIGVCGKGAYIRRRKSAGMAEAAIAGAGPMVNLVIALVVWRVAANNALWHWVALVNAVLALSNLVPLGASDGKRMWRALREGVNPRLARKAWREPGAPAQPHDGSVLAARFTSNSKS